MAQLAGQLPACRYSAQFLAHVHACMPATPADASTHRCASQTLLFHCSSAAGCHATTHDDHCCHSRRRQILRMYQRHPASLPIQAAPVTLHPCTVDTQPPSRPKASIQAAPVTLLPLLSPACTAPKSISCSCLCMPSSPRTRDGCHCSPGPCFNPCTTCLICIPPLRLVPYPPASCTCSTASLCLLLSNRGAAAARIPRPAACPCWPDETRSCNAAARAEREQACRLAAGGRKGHM